MFHKAIVRSLLTATVVASAVTSQAVIIDMVSVGNPGNAPTSVQSGQSGAVPYNFDIGKYEVTNTQYCEFLNAKAKSDPYALYNTAMGSDAMGGITRSGSESNYSYLVRPGRENKPVVYVCFYDTVRFANWLTNGQGNGDTENGSYSIIGGGANSGEVAEPSVSQRATWATGATRNWLLPTEDEWYKAAYYDPNKAGGAGYWLYPTGSNTPPAAQGPPGTDATNGSANYNDAVGDLTDVGAYIYKPSTSPYGTFDQGGNAFEWNEKLSPFYEPGIPWLRGLRGGAFYTGYWALRPVGYGNEPAWENYDDGFRVASVGGVPEPSSVMLVLVGAVSLFAYAFLRRKRTA